MIEAAERAGAIGPGATLVEATAGNTGLGLALVAARKGYRLVLVIPDKMSQEKVFHLRALGAEVRMTRSDVAKGHPEYYQDMAERIAREIGRLLHQPVRQPGQPGWPTRPPPRPRSGGRWTGGWTPSCAASARAAPSPGCRATSPGWRPQVEMVLADPAGSVLADYVKTGQLGAGRLLAGRGHRRGLHALHRRSVARASRPTPSPTRRA